VNILLVNPQPADRDDVVASLNHSGHEVLVVESAAQAPAQLAQGTFELVVIDLASADTLRFLRKHSAQRGAAPVVCIADRRKPEASTEALRLGVADIVGRPVRQDDLLAAMANAREMVRVADRPAPSVQIDVTERVEGVFGASPAIRDVIGMVRRVSQSRCGVLIVGERGTGREMIARAVHAQGSRRDRPFLKVVCADASSVEFEQVFNSGAPPGATVYLEDLEDLPTELQVRLESRVRSVEQVTAAVGVPGTPQSTVVSEPTSVRYVAGVLPSINDLITRGAVRGSLVDAVGVVRIDLPPLRQRPEDIPLLATHFLKDACRRADQPSKTFSRSALTLLAALPWPGNAGELRSLTERLAVLVPRGVVTLEDLLANVRLGGSEAVGRVRGSLKDAREQFERDYVTAVLQHHHGRMGAAARELGIERTNLYRKIKQLNIRWNIE
jgi:DNA-binding NtrC family response regulator